MGHDDIAAATHSPRPVPALGLQDAGELPTEEVIREAGLQPEQAEQLWRSAQDEVLSELKGESLERQRSAGQHEELQLGGALGKYARVAAHERHDTVRHVLDSVPPARVDLARLDSGSGAAAGQREQERREEPQGGEQAAEQA